MAERPPRYYPVRRELPANYREKMLAETSPRQLREALAHYARGRTPEAACKLAGLPSAIAFREYILQDSFANDLRKMMRGVLECEYAPAAFQFLNAVVRDTKMPARVRVDAAKCIVDRAGYVAAAPDPHAAGKELENMSLDELNRFILDLKAKLASQARDVTPPIAEDGLEIDVPAGKLSTTFEAEGQPCQRHTPAQQ